MFGIDNFTTFVFSAIVFTITPGLATIYIINKSISEGKYSAIFSSFGIILGGCIHIFLTAFGLSAILAKSEFAFSLVRYVGAGYLLYLGLRAIINNGVQIKLIKNKIFTKKSKWQNFREGLFINILNPKVALFFLSFFPQFISEDYINSIIPYIILGIVQVIIGLTWFLILSYFSNVFFVKFQESAKFSFWFNKICGIVFILMGIKFAF